jgi:hypothetical protein
MKKLLFFIFSVLCIAGCSGIYSEDEMTLSQKPISLTIEDLSNGGFNRNIDLSSAAINGNRLKLEQYGHCYIFDTIGTPDTSSAKAKVTEEMVHLGINAFYSSISYDNTNLHMKVRGFIVFADSVIYSPILSIKLNQHEH